MRVYYLKRFLRSFSLNIVWAPVFFILFFPLATLGQPANDNCTNASVITIPSGGFGIGTFTSTTYDISSATIQGGEIFAPAILVAGQTQKSIWYKFTLPTTRSVRVTLAQTGTAITAGDVGFAVYKINACLPTVADISTKLTPIGLFGSTFHPCVEQGDYLVQVSAKNSANGSVYIQVETNTTTAAYDIPVQAYDFGTLTEGVQTIYYDVDCQSTEDATEICTALNNYQQYNKSTWHVFTTPAYFDFIAFFLSHQSYWDSETFGYKLYQGDVRTSPYSSLPVVDGCDSLLAPSYYAARKFYKCEELNPNTTYSIQIFFNQNFFDNVQVTLATTGFIPTQAPEPILSSIPSSNSLGVLPSSPTGVITTATDYHACNSRHSLHPCDPSLPAAGITLNDVSYNGFNYNLSTFFRFTLSSISNVSIYIQPNWYNSFLLVRLFKQDVSNSCNTLDTVNIVSQFINSNFDITCLDPGNYTIQVSGRDTIKTFGFTYGYFGNSNTPVNVLTDLGQKFTLNINVKTSPVTNKYSLNVPGAFDTLNVVSGTMQPLVNGVFYNTQVDTFGCANTVLPWDTACSPTNKKAIYSEFAIADSGIVSLYAAYPYLWNKLYMGDANALANAQNAYSFPARITGLTPYTQCLQFHNNCHGDKVCIVPGTYTYVTFGDSTNVGQPNQSMPIRFDVVNTNHNSPANAEDMGDILSMVPPTGGSVQSTKDYFSCKDNAIAINSYQPCAISGQPATKAIYRQFYLSVAANISISGAHFPADLCSYSSPPFGGYMTLFSGKATDGIAGLTALPAPWQCFKSASIGTCNTLTAGWYTIVSYGSGPSYANPFQNLNQFEYSSYAGLSDQVTITITIQCPGPKYNRPYKAAIDTITNQPFLIQWAPRAGHTVAYPKTDTTYTLYQENYNCTIDTPFTSHPIPNCDASLTKVTYYVFRTTQESYVQIDTKNFWGAVYAGNARTDSASFANATPIQPCLQSNGDIKICHLQPGTYTLVVFATNANGCNNVTPTIYIDQVGYSRFDHANNAYDFGAIPPDSLYHIGKVGDINPLNAGRAPSNDFFYCTTGARQNDPFSSGCYYLNYLLDVYNAGVNNALYSTSNFPGQYYNDPRRNLWYTFVVNKPGTVRVNVSNKTIGKQSPYKFAIYKSNVDGTLPFATIVSTGQVDSTILQGLIFVKENFYSSGSCSGLSDEVDFYRDPCTSITQRYYIIVDNPALMQPNSQVEVSILLDSIDVNYPGDFCSAPVVATLNGAGANVSSVTIDCHTIGTDYGEFNPTLTCPNGANTTEYKTSWFRIDITGTDTLDVTTYLSETTNAFPTDIKYRLMNGDCSAMQERSCVQDAQTQDTYKCLPPGSYYIQVFTPVNKNNISVTGTIDLHLSAVAHADTCAPINNCFANANFNPQFNCTTDDSVRFVNYSTFGSSITYDWNFGYAGQTSNAVSPSFMYPVLATDQVYNVKLVVQNNSCAGRDSITIPVNIPGRPEVNLGNDTSLCNGGSLGLNASSWPGATYYWQNGSTNPIYTASNIGQGTYYVSVTYNGCIKRDTINVNINPLSPLKEDKYLCGNNPISLNSSRGYGETYSWNTGAASSSINVTAPGIYWNDVFLYGCTIRDSFIVTNAVYPLGNDKQVCFGGQPFILDAASAGAVNYTWQNGTSGPVFNALTAGIYWVDISFGNCILRDSIVLMDLQPLITFTSVLTCAGNGYTLPSGAIISASGVYNDTLSSAGGCDSVITFLNITFEPVTDITFNAGICSGQTYTLPWGAVVNSAGIYSDTLRSNFGCDSIRSTVNLSVQSSSSLTINGGICSGQTYTLPWGAIVNAAGVYKDTLHYINTGCDSLYRTVNLSVASPQSLTLNPIICAGQTYSLPWGAVVNTAGVYKDTLHYIAGCDSLYRTVNLTVQSTLLLTINSEICAGQTYTLPWGTVVNTSGVYKDTLRYNLTGCDSLQRTVNLTVQSSASTTINAGICSGQTYTLPWGAIVNATGIYKDTVHYINTGCDSLYRTVNLSVALPQLLTLNPIICSGQNYTLPWGAVVNTAGVYKDTLHYIAGCDSLYRTVNLTVQSPLLSTINSEICAGQTYTLPWGTVVTASGVYKDTLRYSATNCDSLFQTVNLTVQSSVSTTINAGICSGQAYTLPWGVIVNAAGIYKDTLHYINTGCDSLYRTVNLSVASPQSLTLNPVICEGQTYSLPWGAVVNTSGVYKDTLHYVAGCDSLYRTVNLTVQSTLLLTINSEICAGQTYTLPWGTVVTASGVYKDTLRYSATNCDSLFQTVNLTVQSSASTTINAGICSGQAYTLPWGAIVNAAGIYKDTLHYVNTGCDSLYRTVNLSVASPQSLTMNPIICAGQTYSLPWGSVVNTAGTYKDTLHYTGGCDSLYRTVNLTVQSSQSSVLNPVICAGQTYTLPWGAVINTSGVYHDTLRYSITGCDSLRRTVNLTVQSPSSLNINAGICTGQTYTLPWGTVVNTAGVYKDTLRYSVTNCDSLYRTVNLSVAVPQSQTLNSVICSGQSYILPWGVVVNTTGTYKDTLHYSAGCDSLYRTVNLTVQSLQSSILNPVICAGQTYTLPWGATVNTSGIYRDTLRYTTGCDSVLRIVNLSVQAVTNNNSNVSICDGQTHTLPWGVVVNTSGIYRDTLRYTTGCDSVFRVVNLIVQAATTINSSATICGGQTYLLPWGAVANSSGVYRDTLRFNATGCDSLRRIVNLTVQASNLSTTNITICQGQSYTLPWGILISSAGVYKDTLHYNGTGCDSLYRVINLTITPAQVSDINASICMGESYALPWGVVVTTPGIYKDTVRTLQGCDSLIRNVNLIIKPNPGIILSKSNDIDCMISTTRLNAAGGIKYLWSPASSLTNSTISNPVASPTQTTMYYLQVTANNGCITEDSIKVIVNMNGAENGFLLPNAFTPNGDGKNDCFGVRTWGNVSNLKLEIYNRWGEIVFRTSDPSQCWNGTYNGERQSTAVFVYQVWAETICGKVYRKGTVTLIR